LSFRNLMSELSRSCVKQKTITGTECLMSRPWLDAAALSARLLPVDCGARGGWPRGQTRNGLKVCSLPTATRKVGTNALCLRRVTCEAVRGGKAIQQPALIA